MHGRALRKISLCMAHYFKWKTNPPQGYCLCPSYALWTFVCHGMYPQCKRVCVCQYGVHAPPEKWDNVYLQDDFLWFECLLFHYSSCLLILSITHTQRRKEEATRGFLTSWPSDKIESVLLPSPTKGLWKRRVSSWLGLHVATDGGKPGGRKGRKRGNNAMHIYLFKLSICCVAWAWLGRSICTQAHTHTLCFTHSHTQTQISGQSKVGWCNILLSYTSHHHEVHNYWFFFFFLLSLHFAKS